MITALPFDLRSRPEVKTMTACGSGVCSWFSAALWLLGGYSQTATYTVCAYNFRQIVGLRCTHNPMEA